jgi:hypothetical protein
VIGSETQTHAPVASRARRRRGVPRGVLIALAAAAPTLVTVVLLYVHLGAHVRDFVPSFWNDQVGYWHRAASFSRVGLDSGYYAPNEHTAAWALNRFGVGGPWYPALYGAIGSLVGWELWTSIPINVVLLGLALAAFCLVGRLDRTQILLVALVGAAFWPIVLYIPTSSHEPLNQALALALALAMVPLIDRGGELSMPARLLIVALVVVASVIRLSWAVLLLPVALFAGPPSVRATLVRVAGATVLLAVLYWIAKVTQPPSYHSVIAAVNSVSSSPLDGVRALVDVAADNARAFVEAKGLDPTTTNSTSLNPTHVESWTMIALVLVGLVVALRARSAPVRREWLFHVLNLAGIAVAAFLLYLPLGYFRVMGAHLLVSVLVMIKRRTFVPAGVLLAACVVLVVPFLGMYDGWKPNFDPAQRARIEADQARFARDVHYDASAPSPWCNTLFLSVALYDARVTAIPPGIGVAYHLTDATSDPLRLPLKSQWVLLGVPNDEALDPVLAGQRLEHVATYSFGRLYRTARASCAGGATAG